MVTPIKIDVPDHLDHLTDGGSPESPPRRGRLLVLLVIFLIGAGVALSAQRLLRSSSAPSGHESRDAVLGMAGMNGASPPAASNGVYISPARQQLIGVRTTVVERQRLDGTVRTVGTLAYDETRETEIHTRVAGWVERLFVDYVGKPVRRGQPLFAVYSPDLVTAQSDYLVAWRARAALASSSSPATHAANDALLLAARQRLERWGVSDAQISDLEQRGEAKRTLTLSSPFDGVVLERNTFAGQFITPEMSTFKIADLSTIWVLGQVFEYEATMAKAGQRVEIEFPYGQRPGPLSASIDFVYPGIDPQTRRVRFRAVLPNPGQRLKPETYVTLVLHGEPIDRVVVPKEAVIDTGARKYVLLALADGYFAPRDIEVGTPVGDFYPVVSGVTEGDRVVTSAQFLVDSETNLMAAMQNMSMSMPGMGMGGSQPKGPAAPSAAPVPMPPMPGMGGGPSPTPSTDRPAPPPRGSTNPPMHEHSAPVPAQPMPSMPGMPAPSPTPSMPPGHNHGN
jgi:RND family efflux transporter MFP subunit